MKVVAFNGSPRQNGNTAILIGEVFKELAKEGIATELVQLPSGPVQGCVSCMKCFQAPNGKCSLTGDPLNSYIAKMSEADGIILASPTYFADLTPQLKALIDRAGLVAKANNGLLARKVGAAVVAARRGGAVHTFDSINHFFTISEMVVVGSDYWNMGVGLLEGDVAKDAEGLQTMRRLGQNMAWLLKKLSGSDRDNDELLIRTQQP